MISAIIFDVGGVLLRTMDWSERHKWERRLNLPHNSLEPLVHGTTLNQEFERGEVAYNAFWDEVCRRLGVPADLVMQFREDFYAGDQLNSELMTHIRAWRAKGFRLGIISNAPPNLRLTLAHRLHIVNDFDAIVISSEVGVRKPHADIYYHALNALDVQPNDAIFVDDLKENVEGARAIGMLGVHFTDNQPAIEQINALLIKN
jgi:epoxide hydrolase-like predicted phosphatase